MKRTKNDKKKGKVSCTGLNNAGIGVRLECNASHGAKPILAN